MPTFVKGDDVQTTDKKSRGRVLSVSGDSVIWQDSWGQRRTTQASALETSEGFGGKLAAYSPDLMELGANVMVFAGTQLARKRKAFGEPTMRFLAEDLVYEVALKSWMQENIEGLISDTARQVLTGSAANNFATQDIQDAALKTLSIGIIDCVYKLVRGGKINMSTMWYLLQVAASFEIANVAQRYLRPAKDTAPYRPQ